MTSIIYKYEQEYQKKNNVPNNRMFGFIFKLIQKFIWIYNAFFIFLNYKFQRPDKNEKVN